MYSIQAAPRTAPSPSHPQEQQQHEEPAKEQDEPATPFQKVVTWLQFTVGWYLLGAALYYFAKPASSAVTNFASSASSASTASSPSTSALAEQGQIIAAPLVSHIFTSAYTLYRIVSLVFTAVFIYNVLSFVVPWVSGSIDSVLLGGVGGADGGASSTPVVVCGETQHSDV
jgi:hypothetical protein